MTPKSIFRCAATLSVLVLFSVCGGVTASEGPNAQEPGSIEASLESTQTVHLTVEGASSKVTFVRDAQGTPHIRVPNELLGYGGLCFAMAQDRLWQMDLLRRTAQGRVAEIVGPGPDQSVLLQDKVARVQGLARIAEERYSAASPHTRAVLSACAVGINTYRALAIATGTLPPEFGELGYIPERWRPQDSFAVAAFVASSLDLSTWQTKLEFGVIASLVSPEVAAALIPEPPESPSLFNAQGTLNPPQVFQVPLGNPQLAPAPIIALSKPPKANFLARLPRSFYGLGVLKNRASNCFAVDGALTTTGKPLLANDPHLALTTPTLAYLAHLDVPGAFNAQGILIPGLPFFLSGHSPDHSWGVTFAVLDDVDLYVETVRGSGVSEEVLYLGNWVPVQSRTEEIRVAGAPSVFLTVKTTPHGPVLNAALPELDAFGPIALKATVAQPEWRLDGIFQIPSATSWTAFQAAAQSIAFGLNWHFADRLGAQGHIAYTLGGLVPQRNLENTFAPVPGGDGLHEWIRYATPDELPSVYDPPSHLLATGNNRLVPNDYAPNGQPVYLSRYYDMPWRTQRIVTRLLLRAGPLSPADMGSIQLDTQTVHGIPLRDAYVAALLRTGLPPGDPTASSAFQQLQSWDGNASATSSGAAIFETLTALLVRDMGTSALGPELFSEYAPSVFYAQQLFALQGVLANPSPPFFGATSPGDAGLAKDQAILQAFTEANALLRGVLGAQPSTWAWGAIHTLTYNHPLAAADPRFAIGTFPSSGDVGTVRIGGWFGATGNILSLPPAELAAAGGLQAAFDQDAWPIARLVWNLGAANGSLGVLATGESGRPGSPHFKDQAPAWRAGKLFQLAFSSTNGN